MEFFYRYDSLHLVPGNKSAGFFFTLEPRAVLELSTLKMAAPQRQRVIESARERILNAELLTKRGASSLVINYWEDTALPRVFSVDPVFGGSLGCEPEVFSWLGRPDALEWVQPHVAFFPHNVDAPKHSLALLLLVQSWCEFAGAPLGEHRRAREETPA